MTFLPMKSDLPRSYHRPNRTSQAGWPGLASGAAVSYLYQCKPEILKRPGYLNKLSEEIE